MVSEILDSILIGEGVLPSLRDARDRLLVPSAPSVPCRARTWGRLVQSNEVRRMHDLSATPLQVCNPGIQPPSLPLLHICIARRVCDHPPREGRVFPSEGSFWVVQALLSVRGSVLPAQRASEEIRARRATHLRSDGIGRNRGTPLVGRCVQRPFWSVTGLWERPPRGAGTGSQSRVPTPLGAYLPRYQAPPVPTSLGTYPMGLGT